MTSKEVLERLANGATLCMEYTPDEDGKCYWLEPGRFIIRRDVAERLIPMLKPGGDRLFDDVASQTWRA